MLALADMGFNRLHTHIKTNYGTDLSKKKQLIVSRLSSTLVFHGYRSFSGYVDEILTDRDKETVIFVLNKLTTSYTYFLREETHFRFLQNTVLPDLARKRARDKTLFIWSAGCSSGEGPYTVSIHLKEFFGSQVNSWDTRVLATDISQQIPNRTRNPVYREESLECLSPSRKQKYFVKNKDNTYTVALATEQNVISQTFNLMNPIRFRWLLDSIFRRDVVTYFDQATKDTLVWRFYDATMPGGYLLIGHSEGLNKAACPYECLMPVIYQKTRR